MSGDGSERLTCIKNLDLCGAYAGTVYLAGARHLPVVKNTSI